MSSEHLAKNLNSNLIFVLVLESKGLYFHCKQSHLLSKLGEHMHERGLISGSKDIGTNVSPNGEVGWVWE